MSLRAISTSPPDSEQVLLERARGIAGCSFAELASELGLAVPTELARAKGWVGTLLERALGASAGSRSEPDFPELGVELKSLPIDTKGVPRESTFVCTVELSQIPQIEWQASRVKNKLNRVLWVPVESDRAVPIAERRVGTPLLWSPDPEEEAALRFDWEELAGQIAVFGTESVTAHLGRFLQVRPKAAHSRVRRMVIDAEGTPYSANPRGFYLRTAFTKRLLERHYAGLR